MNRIVRKYNIQTVKDGDANLASRPGVYYFYDSDDTLLYVGESVNVRDRIYDHLRGYSRQYASKRIRDEAASVAISPTAGKIGAQLRELYAIKEQKPLLNKRSRKKKKLTFARVQEGDAGYMKVDIERVDAIQKDDYANILGVYKSKHHAKEQIRSVAQDNGICLKRLGMSVRPGTGPCFGFQLDTCDGACVGKVSPEEYNDMIRTAFAKYMVKRWPYETAQTITETRSRREDTFVVDDWWLVDARTTVGDETYAFFDEIPEEYMSVFNYDMYKVLANHLLA
jgi:excinuclease UvrABC nuclease subunit